MAPKTTSQRSKLPKLSAAQMKELAGKYSRSRDKRKARPKLIKKFGKVQAGKIIAMAKKMEAATDKAKKTTSARKKTTSARKKTTSTKKTTSARKPKKSPGRVRQGKKLQSAQKKLAAAEFKKRKKALIAAYKKHRGSWAKWVGKCKSVALAKMVKDAAGRSK